MYIELFDTIKAKYNINDKSSIKYLQEWRKTFLEFEPKMRISENLSGKTLPNIPWVSLSGNGTYYVTILFSAINYEPFLSIQAKTDGYSKKNIASRKNAASIILWNQFQVNDNEVNLNSKGLIRAKNYEDICPLSVSLAKKDELEIQQLITKFKFYVDFLNKNDVAGIFRNDQEFEEAEQLIKSGFTFAEVKQRIGQSKWREALISKMGERCAVCNIHLKDLLVASHIKDWSKSNEVERTSLKNGLVLCNMHDKLFDRKFISFDENGRILISDKIRDLLDELNISENTIINSNYFDGTKLIVNDFMEWHRKEFKK